HLGQFFYILRWLLKRILLQITPLLQLPKPHPHIAEFALSNVLADESSMHQYPAVNSSIYRMR
ncbi:TPA: hypothetical protein ACQVSL_004836, partial [Serratia marcescens]